MGSSKPSSSSPSSGNPSQRRYPPELKERGVRMVLDLRRADPADTGVVARVARQLGVGVESLRTWVKQTEIDSGSRPGTTTADAARIKELEQENRELRRANEILKRASAFFAAELDRPHK